MTASKAKDDAARPASISAHKRKITLSVALKLCDRYLEDYRPHFETYVRVYRALHGFDPDTLEVSNVWPEDAIYDD